MIQRGKREFVLGVPPPPPLEYIKIILYVCKYITKHPLLLSIEHFYVLNWWIVASKKKFK